MIMIKTTEEVKKRKELGNTLLMACKGCIINQKTAKKLSKLTKGFYSITESRLDDKTSLVVMRESIYSWSDEHDRMIQDFGDEVVFLVEGVLGKKLNME